jgi:hypothetical protein
MDAKLKKPDRIIIGRALFTIMFIDFSRQYDGGLECVMLYAPQRRSLGSDVWR